MLGVFNGAEHDDDIDSGTGTDSGMGKGCGQLGLALAEARYFSYESSKHCSSHCS